jgi:hypothetical protein
MYSRRCLITLPNNRTTIYKLVRFKVTDQECIIMFRILAGYIYYQIVMVQWDAS